MADMIEMNRFYSQFQAARIKQEQKKRALDKLRKAVQDVPDEDTMLDLLEKIKAAEAEYKTASEEAEVPAEGTDRPKAETCRRA